MMRLSEKIKPLSYLAANAVEINKAFDDSDVPRMITQNGEPELVVIPIDTYNQSLETLAFLRIAVMGNAEISAVHSEDANKRLEHLGR
jgi:PHD/YefM family antitoxin component YafN of YafNO toxin-antitoxin module